MPDANTIWTFREALTKAAAIERLFELFDRELRAQGYLAMSGQLVDASIVAAPKQRNTHPRSRRSEKAGCRRTGRTSRPSSARGSRCALDRQDDQAKPREGEAPRVDLAIPEFGYQNISADRRHRLIRKWLVTILTRLLAHVPPQTPPERR